MNKYGAEHLQDHRFTLELGEIERRGLWIDVRLNLQAEPGQVLPEDLSDPSVYVICNLEGTIVQYILLDEGCDSEFMFTPAEKEQIAAFIRQHCGASIKSLSGA
ncbi:hypothetical protein [Paenibacillus lutrae]|uniref:Uncharacterized protein n=1 Tax=Paenibacillus lutrae TaxID=2078573 RepID=A0A7X3FME1_9BACL|nr:hypothetical protein [Paenibacillus lutrae]MVP02386.1 hypothetical protein [Paenibacillus lutrae]